MKTYPQGIAVGFISLLLSLSLHASQVVEVGQKDKQFSQSTLTVKKGDTVRFVNNDPFFHNVFSLSDAKLFDLGSYPQGEYRDVEFDQSGTVEVECALHPSMTLTIEVTDK